MARGWIRRVLESSEFEVVQEMPRLDLRTPLRAGAEAVLAEAGNLHEFRSMRLRGPVPPTILMTTGPRRGFNEAARAAGAAGTLVKSDERARLVGVLRAVAASETFFDPRHPPRPYGQGALTARERDVLRLVATGATNSVVADTLGVSPGTVKTLLARARAKLTAKTRTHAVSLAQEQGLI